jgi:glutamate synthase (NADH)
MSGAQGFSFKLRSNSLLGAVPVSNLKRNIRQDGRATQYSVSRRLNAISLESEFLGTNSPVPEEVAQPWDEQEEKQVVVSENENGPEHTSLSMLPEKPIGLYDPSFERDSCGVGFIAELSGMYKRETVRTLHFILLFIFWRYWFSYAFLA